jgi:putative tryptophan/tyrosine transport system substrate-binding protein
MDGPQPEGHMASHIGRRKFLVALGDAVAAWPLAARAQQPAMPVVGFVNAGSSDAPLAAAFCKGLNEAGYFESQNVTVEYHWLEGKFDRLPALMTDLVRRRVSVIATPAGNFAALVAKGATTTIPIVFGVGEDPVKLGLVASLARPGGNITGVMFTVTDVTAKRLELLRELVPKAAVIGVLLDPNSPEAEIESKDAEAAGRAIGRRVLVVKATSEREFNAAFSTIVQAGAGALLVGGGPFFLSQRRQLVALAARYALPASYVTRQYALLAFGGMTQCWRRWG